METLFISFLIDSDHSNGLSPNGLENGESVPLSPPFGFPLGGGLGGMPVIITREIELSRIILVISGLVYDSFGNIFRTVVFKC